MKKFLNALVFFAIILFSTNCLARENVSDWYIKEFKTNIDVRSDSSLDITETILADCGPAKRHGIYRVLPTRQILDNEEINSPIILESITDPSGKEYKYETTNDRINHTVSWKIGDPDKYVSGENIYIIKYHVKNAVRHGNTNFDELYWNLNGNFWELETDRFQATVNFPPQINQSNTTLNLYSGEFNEKNSLGIESQFISDHTIGINYDQTLGAGQGITLSATFPKNIVAPYKPSLLEKFGEYLSLLIPLFALWLCIKLWKRYGDDPSVNPTIAPEFEIPEKLAPIDMGILQTDGLLRSNFVTASIINLAVNGRIKIKKLEGKGVLKKDDFELEKTNSKYKPSTAEDKLLASLFGSKTTIKTSELRNNFYTHLSSISSAANTHLTKKGYLVSNSRLPQWIMLTVGIVVMALSIVALSLSTILTISLAASGILFVAFSFVMPRRTLEGLKLLGRVKGFRLYLDKVEKYRQQVLEKQDTFEKMLPYAMLFGMTKQYIRKMHDIYGENYFNNYHPSWYYYAAASNFSIGSFGSEISDLSGYMSSTISSSPPSSGSGGGGFSGGGGGGGGGGGW